MKKIINIVGARPQFIKLAPFSNAIRQSFHEIIINSGQHYDDRMSQIFFNEMKIARPDYNLGVSSGSHALQTAKILCEVEEILIKEKPDCVCVFGDTNTTLAGTLAASKLCIPILHIESGLRSFDRRMPEEQNRIVSDHLATILACPTQVAVNNLKKEGIRKNVYLTGDLMYDAVLSFQELYESRPLPTKIKNYSVLTMHRPSNVDKKKQLIKIFNCLKKLNRTFVFPIHPRTQKNILDFSIEVPDNIKVIDSLGYLEMMSLMSHSDFVFTDSGGLQKEAFFLNKKCITLRDSTEWVETIDCEVNMLALDNKGEVKIHKILDFLKDVTINKNIKHPYGNGKSAEKIIRIISKLIK